MQDGGKMTGGVGRGGQWHNDDEHGEMVTQVKRGNELADLAQPQSGMVAGVVGSIAEVSEVSTCQSGGGWEEASWDSGCRCAGVGWEPHRRGV